ncbi:MAG TPA: isoprenylcysteine carboxylmethyltransferase family protein [Candidatus Dormibacteraeota bacterium]|nr:isoprenylcysteine carboxylmethyltransferase family protein [Candidatus Dormibacteraeota bacterium]
MRATDFEFRNRFWMFGAIYGIAFYCYRFDHVNAGVALLHWLAPSINEDSPAGLRALHVIFGVGALFLAAFAIIRTWATSYLQADVVHDSKIRTEGLVGDGPYRYVRNPLYFANLLQAIGIGLLASRLGWLIAVGVNLLFQYRLILREESELLRTQGESYRRFISAVPRLWPAIRPKIPPSGISPRWRQAFAGESFFWIFALALVCFAITLNVKLTGIFLGVSILGYMLMQLAGRWGSKRSAA